jgi:hypothetical protein
MAPYILLNYIQLTHLYILHILPPWKQILFYRKKSNPYQLNPFLGEPYQLKGLRGMIRRVLENIDERV